MSLILPPPTPAPLPPADPAVTALLKEKQQAARWLPSLYVLAGGLALSLIVLWSTNFSFKPPVYWLPSIIPWSVLAGLTLLVTFLLVRRSRLSLEQIARALDGNWQSKNRLEASAELIGLSSPLAQAQREETSQYLNRERAPALSKKNPLRFWVWLAIFLALLHLITLSLWTAFAAIQWFNTPDASPPTAEISWIKPASEIKATPIEEIQMQARVVSSGGVKDLTLEVFVNGEPKKQIPIPSQEVQKAGQTVLSFSLFLDEIELVPFDMVSYHLKAQRKSFKPLPETSSPIQFIQIRPFRDDALLGEAGDMGGEDLLPLITMLKSAQLRALKENFLLSYSDLPKDSPVRRPENTRVGEEQKLLAQKTREVIEKLTQLGAPAEIINLLVQAEELMPKAGQNILDDKNKQALPLQGKSLAFITEVEKFVRKIVAPPGGQAPPPSVNVSDPFKDKQKFEMPKREDTAAGSLEMLAKEQEKLAKELAQNSGDSSPSDGKPKPGASDPKPGSTDTKPENGPDKPGNEPQDPAGKEPAEKPGTISGTTAERQTQISQGISSLLNGKKLSPDVNARLEKAHEQAKNSLKHLDASDPAQAREPASMAAAELKKALELLTKEGEEKARQALADAQKGLNQAAQDAKASPTSPGKGKGEKASQQTKDTEAKLLAAALKQQEAGSEKAAKTLADMAHSIQESKVQEDLKKLAANPGDKGLAQNASDKLGSLAAESARKGQASGKMSTKEIQKLLSDLESNRNTLKSLAALEGRPKDAKGSKEKGSGSEKSSDPKSGGAEPGKEKSPGSEKGEGPKGAEGQGQGEGKEKSSGPKPGGAEPGKEKSPGSGGGSPQEGSPTSMEDSGTQQAESKGSGSGDSSSGGSVGSNGPDDKSTNQIATGTIGNIDHETATRETLQNLLENIQQLEAYAGSLPENPENKEAKESIGTGGRVIKTVMDKSPYLPVKVIMADLEKPLDSVSRWLNAQLGQDRTFLLNTPDFTQAPAAYREAVSDYFEELSKDFEKPKPAGSSQKKP